MKLVEKARQKLGGLDIVVNVAGHQVATDTIEEISTEQFDETFKTNVLRDVLDLQGGYATSGGRRNDH